MAHISIRLTDQEKEVIAAGAALPPKQSLNQFVVESAIAATHARIAIYKDVAGCGNMSPANVWQK